MIVRSIHPFTHPIHPCMPACMHAYIHLIHLLFLISIQCMNQSFKSDPYCVVTWNGKVIGKSTTINNSNNPFWEDQYFKCIFPWDVQQDNRLSIEVYDRDVVGKVGWFLSYFYMIGKLSYYPFNQTSFLIHHL